jgi:hypothetical protein
MGNGDNHIHVYCSPVYNSQVMLSGPSMDKRIKKMWLIHTMEYYSVIKNNNIFSCVRKYKVEQNMPDSQRRESNFLSCVELRERERKRERERERERGKCKRNY